MDQLLLGLFAEGTTDDRFLPPIIYRTSVQILTGHGRDNEWDEILIKPIKLTVKQRENRTQSILEAAARAHDYHLLIIHADADDPTPHKARRERIDPGLELVRQARRNVCKELLPIIPIQAIESWMFADHQALLKKLGIDKKVAGVDLPKGQRIEAIAKPKMRLKKILEEVNSTRSQRQRVDLDELYAPLGDAIDLEKLKLLSSYKDFIKDLTNAFTSLGIISPTLNN